MSLGGNEWPRKVTREDMGMGERSTTKLTRLQTPVARESQVRLSVWKLAAMSFHEEILEKLWTWGKEVQLSSQDLKDLLLDEEEFEESVWHWAAGRGHVKLLEKLWAWDKEVQLNSQDFKDLFLDKHEYGQSVWHLAAQSGHVK
jgi:hypothetical protein